MFLASRRPLELLETRGSSSRPHGLWLLGLGVLRKLPLKGGQKVL